jgi:hypothetical protein
MSDGISQGMRAAADFRQRAIAKYGHLSDEELDERASQALAESERAEATFREAEIKWGALLKERDQLFCVLFDRRRIK